MKVLVTGFDPFGGEPVNPAFEAVKLLPDEIAGAEIVKLEIPTVFSKSGPAVEEGIQKYEPDVVINVGQAGVPASPLNRWRLIWRGRVFRITKGNSLLTNRLRRTESRHITQRFL